MVALLDTAVFVLTLSATDSDWVPVACSSSFSAGSVSSSAGSACSISAGRVTMATPSFGTYYLATAVTGIAVPAAQVVAAAPASVNIPASSVDSIDNRPSDGYRILQPEQRPCTAHSHHAQRHRWHFFRRLRRRPSRLRHRVRAAIACSIPVPRMTALFSFLISRLSSASPPASKPVGNAATAHAAWSRQQSLEMQSQAPDRDAPGQSSRRVCARAHLLTPSFADAAADQLSPVSARGQAPDIALSPSAGSSYLKPKCGTVRSR